MAVSYLKAFWLFFLCIIIICCAVFSTQDLHSLPRNILYNDNHVGLTQNADFSSLMQPRGKINLSYYSNISDAKDNNPLAKNDFPLISVVYYNRQLHYIAKSKSGKAYLQVVKYLIHRQNKNHLYNLKMSVKPFVTIVSFDTIHGHQKIACYVDNKVPIESKLNIIEY